MPKKKTGRTESWNKTILGQPYSKANSRMLVSTKGVSRFIKSPKALRYAESFKMQCPTLDPLFEDDVRVELDIYYASRRPDLDESLILDLLQGKVYRNDRQVREKLVRWGIDPGRPRTEIHISLLTGHAGR